MSSKRRIGVSIATSEAARRQLMQPVPVWEKAWATPLDAAAGSSLKVFKWVKTDRKQNFSDDEEEADEPLAPLPDEPEVNDADEDMEQDDVANSSVAPEVASRAVSEPASAVPPDDAAPPPLPKPHPLSMSLVPGSPTGADAELEEDGRDATLEPLDVNLEDLDTSVLDTSVLDTSVLDTSVLDTSVLDTSVLDTSVLDTSVLDTSVLDNSVLDTSVLDTSVLDGSVELEDQEERGNTSPQLQIPLELSGDDVDLDAMGMGELGPDGTQFEGAGDLSQLQDMDATLGGEVMDESGDPFVPLVE